MRAGRTALVTGAASGQGAQVATTLAAEGFAVGLMDVDEAGLAATADRIAGAGGRAIPLPVDVTEPEAVEAAIGALEAAAGPPWVLAAAAGVLEGGFALEMPADRWKAVTEVNFLGVVHVALAAARRMVVAAQGGRIVTWSSASVAGPAVGFGAYVASKAALEAFSRTLAVELAPHRITVNVIRPGSIRTAMMSSFDDEAAAEEAGRIPLGRWGTSQDVAGAVRFLVGDDADWITGAVLAVDGGAVAATGAGHPDAVRERLERERAAGHGR